MDARSDDRPGSPEARATRAATGAGIPALAAVSHRYLSGLCFADAETLPTLLTSRSRSADELLSQLTQPLMHQLQPEASFYRPVAALTWALDQAVWGLRPGGFT